MRFPWSKPKHFAKHAMVYASRTDTKVVVVAQHYVGRPGALMIESEDVVVLEDGNENSGLAQAILKALDSTRVLPDQELRDKKRSEWPAYIASGCRSILQFESEFIAVHVSGAEVNQCVWIEGWPVKDADLSLRCSAIAESPGLGIACMRIIDACRSRQI